MTPADVAGAVTKNVTGPKVWVVVGDRAKIEAGLNELNIGELKQLDGDGKPK